MRTDAVREDVDSFVDKLGRTVKVGDRIAYGHALDRCAGLRIGKVLRIQRGKDWRDREFWSIRVQGIDDEWSFKEPRLCKLGTLGFPERIVKVTGLLPESYEALLDGGES